MRVMVRVGLKATVRVSVGVRQLRPTRAIAKPNKTQPTMDIFQQTG